ncbi:9877_t:CDS:2, partial [Rhizophagus irregularis]
KVKIQTEELPTLDNLVKRKPHVYNSKWKCPMCFKDKETYSHLWKCEHLEQVYLNIIDKFQQYLQELILVNSQMENVNPDDIFKEISLFYFYPFLTSFLHYASLFTSIDCAFLKERNVLMDHLVVPTSYKKH